MVVGWGRGRRGPEGGLHYLRQEKCSASFTSHGKTSRVGLARERKYRGLLNAKGRRGEGVGGGWWKWESDSFPDMKSIDTHS